MTLWIRQRATPFQLLWLSVLFAFTLAPRSAGAATISPDQQSALALEPVRLGYSLQNLSFQLGTNRPYVKEPPDISTNAIRRVIQFGSDTNLGVSFLWDRQARKLYIDENRNLDLTDDPGGVYYAQAAAVQQQQFTNVFLPRPAVRGIPNQCSDITLNEDSRNQNVWASQELRVIWEGKADWAGRSWQVAMIDELGARTTAEGSLLVRPWDMRTNRFWLDPVAGPVPLPERLFWLDRAFALECQQTTLGNHISRQLVFRPQDAPLVNVKVSGHFLDFAVLWASNGYTAVLAGPAGERRMPAGTYAFTSARLKAGAAEAVRASDQPLVLTVAAQTELRLGGPLTNTVTMVRNRRDLFMSYRLAGVDGRNYALANADRSKPPEFALYRGDKRIVAGKFEYG